MSCAADFFEGRFCQVAFRVRVAAYGLLIPVVVGCNDPGRVEFLTASPMLFALRFTRLLLREPTS